MYSSTCFGRPRARHQELNNRSSSLRFYHWSVVVAVSLVAELLMMGARMPETCWAVHKHQVINLRNCCIYLVDWFELLRDIILLFRFTCLIKASDIGIELTSLLLWTEFSTYQPACTSGQLISSCAGHNSYSSGDMWGMFLHPVCNSWCLASHCQCYRQGTLKNVPLDHQHCLLGQIHVFHHITQVNCEEFCRLIANGTLSYCFYSCTYLTL